MTNKVINLHSDPSEYSDIKQDVKDIYKKFGIKVHSIDIKPVQEDFQFDVNVTLFPDLDDYDLDEDCIQFSDSDSQIDIAFTVKPGAIEHPKREQTQLIALVALLNDLLSLDSDEVLTDQQILKANQTFLDKASNDPQDKATYNIRAYLDFTQIRTRAQNNLLFRVNSYLYNQRRGALPKSKTKASLADRMLANAFANWIRDTWLEDPSTIDPSASYMALSQDNVKRFIKAQAHLQKIAIRPSIIDWQDYLQNDLDFVQASILRGLEIDPDLIEKN